MYKFLLLILCISAFACEQSNKTNTDINNSDSTALEKRDNGQSTEEKKAETYQVKAKFLDFDFGDAAHYIFEDETGNKIDFCRIEAEGFQFEIALSEEAIDSENQGFGINQDLQGKWFLLEYYKNVEPLYVDGPDGEVLVISKVTPVEE